MKAIETYDYNVRVTEKDIDMMQHVNNVVYLRYVQDAAAAHWYAVVPEDLAKQVTWVARRHEIDYIRPAYDGEELVVQTWVGEKTAATWERFTEIYRKSDRQLLTRAKSVWVLLNANTKRPRRIDKRFLSCFNIDEV
jgi:acyl-CoA thioester hydrolase